MTNQELHPPRPPLQSAALKLTPPFSILELIGPRMEIAWS